MKPKIYLFCVPLYSGSGAVDGSTLGGDVCGHAVTEDGIELASHISSSEGFAKCDMGLTSERKHNVYSQFYPDGYDLVWVTPEYAPGRGEVTK